MSICNKCKKDCQYRNVSFENMLTKSLFELYTI